MIESENRTAKAEKENTNDAAWSAAKVSEAYAVGYTHSRLRDTMDESQFDTAEFVTEVLQQLEVISTESNRDVAIDKCVGLAHDRGVADYRRGDDYGANLA